MSGLGVPDVVDRGRRRSGDELNAMAAGWRAGVREALGEGERAVAVVVPGGAEAVALVVGLSALPQPMILLSPDVRAWRTEPAIPAGTALVLLPALAALAGKAERLGLVPVVLPEGSTRGAAPPVDAFSGGGVVLFTSGSSGRPKPIFHRMDSIRSWVRGRARAMGLGPGDGVAIGTSPAYSQGFTHLMTATLLGGALGLLDPRDHRLALAMLADPAFRCWRATPHLVDALARCVLTGPAIVPPVCIVSTPITKEVFGAFRDRFGVGLRQAYNTTETGTITLDDSPADQIQPDTVGRPLPGVEVRIGDHPSRPVARGGEGQIWVRTPGLMAGYGFPPRLDRRDEVDGWWPTQDLGTLRADGHVVLGGRRDDAIRTRDNHTVNLAHVAARLCEVDGVVDAAVVPVDTPAGRSFGAVVEHAPGLTVSELRGRLSAALPAWSQPRALALVAALPRLPNGKPDRLGCATLLAERLSG